MITQPERGGREPEVGLQRGQRDRDDRDVEDDHELRDDTAGRRPSPGAAHSCYPQTCLWWKHRRRPRCASTAAHPALELVNTIYAQVGGPVEHDVLTTPDDLVTFARRVGTAGDAAMPSAVALSAARALRESLDPLLRAHLADRGDAARGEAPPGGEARDGAHGAPAHSARLVATSWGEADVACATRAFEGAVRAAQGAARLAPGYAWAWDDADPLSPVHRLAHAAAQLLTGDDLAAAPLLRRVLLALPRPRAARGASGARWPTAAPRPRSAGTSSAAAGGARPSELPAFSQPSAR